MTGFCFDQGIRSVFVGGPFLNAVDPVTKEIDPGEKSRLSVLIDYFEGEGCRVHNAHRRESWGKDFLPPDKCTPLDYYEIGASDLFVAFPGSPPSPGTHVEVGWASALGKPMVLLLEQDRGHAPLIVGLPHVANVELVRYTHVDELVPRLREPIARVMTRHRARPRVERGPATTPATVYAG